MKKIRLDFSKTEERSGWNTKHISEGLHKMKIVSVEETEAQDGVAMLVYALVPENSTLKTRRFPYYCKLQQNQMWKLRDLLVAAGETVPKKAVQIDPSKVVGKCVAAEVEDDSYQGNVRSSVNGTYGLDILEDEDSPESDEDDEVDEDEESVDDGYEEEEDEGDDLDSMSIAELRTLAKSLGISTVKKAKDSLIDEIVDAQADAIEDEEDDFDDEDEEDFDEDDLDDEDLDDEDEEDDEEEVHAAPKRRAAPASKTPAKRTVQRRR